MQPDIFLNGVPYLQTITDVTSPSEPVGIRLEPGLWLHVPATTDPSERPTLARMACIPHGTTIVAQGTSQDATGPPTIPSVGITPPPGTFRFPSQTAASNNTWRIPQDLSPFIAAGMITQEILDDPNTVLRNAIKGQTISIATTPTSPLFGGGADNIAFLLGDASDAHPNAQTTRMTATFWIETVIHEIVVPPHPHGHPPGPIRPQVANGSVDAPAFEVKPPRPINQPVTIRVPSTQIQYSQTVILRFQGIDWPHVSAATLVPHGPVPVPPSAWPS